ncbi:MAG: metallophosphoesterase [Myxococcota bacterium]
MSWRAQEISFSGRKAQQPGAMLERSLNDSGPVCAAPGNHDIARLNLWMRLLDPDRRYRQHILASTHRLVRAAGAVVISLATPRLWSAQLGYLSVKQLNAAHRQLAACQHGELRCVVLHHGLRQLSRLPKRDHLRGRRRATRALLQMGADIVMTGHNHFPHVERLGGPGGFIWSQAGTATSHRFRRFRCQQNSVSVVRADRDHIEIAWYYFKPESGRFIGGETHLFERS